MKSGGLGAVPSYGVPAKRRWRGLVIAVLGLVILSMLVPLVFLLGLHNGFHSSGYVYEQKNSPSVEQSSHVKELMTQFEPTLPKNVVEQYAHEGKNDTIDEAASDNKQRGGSTDTIDRTASDDKQRVGSPDTVDRTASDDKQRVGSPDTIDRTASDDKQRGGSANTIDKTAGDGKQRGSKVPPNDVLQSPPTSNNPGSDHVEQATHPKTSSTDEDRNSCEVTFGSYCLWQQEHRQEMKETLIKKLKDQLFVTRAYYPSIAKLPAKDKLSRQLKQNIQEMEHMLSESTSDADLPPVIVTNQLPRKLKVLGVDT